MNYYQEFWRTYLLNEMMISKIKEFSNENKVLSTKINDLEVRPLTPAPLFGIAMGLRGQTIGARVRVCVCA